MLKKIPLNIPNILSLYRLLSFPILLLFIILDIEELFVIFICINLITDILDGLIARAFNMQTEIGAKIDSLADMGTYILVITAIFVFKFDDFYPYLDSFLPFISLFIFTHLLSVIKFGRFPSLHLYSWKIGGYIQGVFFFVLFVSDFYPIFYIIMVAWGICSFLEHIIIQLISKKALINAKGLFWVLRKKTD